MEKAEGGGQTLQHDNTQHAQQNAPRGVRSGPEWRRTHRWAQSWRERACIATLQPHAASPPQRPPLLLLLLPCAVVARAWSGRHASRRQGRDRRRNPPAHSTADAQSAAPTPAAPRRPRLRHRAVGACDGRPQRRAPPNRAPRPSPQSGGQSPALRGVAHACIPQNTERSTCVHIHAPLKRPSAVERTSRRTELPAHCCQGRNTQRRATRAKETDQST